MVWLVANAVINRKDTDKKFFIFVVLDWNTKITKSFMQIAVYLNKLPYALLNHTMFSCELKTLFGIAINEFLEIYSK